MVHDPSNKPTNPYAAIYANFLRETTGHSLTVTMDDGLNRQMRVGASDTGIWSWNVVTWRGYLATHGDVADGPMFTRVADMIDFFDRANYQSYYSDGAPNIDFRYWAEKLSGGRYFQMREYSSEAFIDLVTSCLDESEELGAEATTEYERVAGVAESICSRRGVDFADYLAELVDSSAKTVGNRPDEVKLFGMQFPTRSPIERRAEILTDAQDNAEEERSARQWLEDNQGLVGQDAYWEADLRDFNLHFIIACYAIELTVRLWREYKSASAAAAPNGNDVILV